MAAIRAELTKLVNPKKHHRRSIRLSGYDYTQARAYFVTIVVQGRDCLFGDIVGGAMVLNDAGCMVESIFDEMVDHYPGVQTDARVVMPNHFHGIVILVGAAPRGRPGAGNPLEGQPRGVAPTMSLADVVHRFKTLTTKRYADGVKLAGWPPFHGRLWQRNYYDHIIRDNDSLNRLREYIETNRPVGRRIGKTPRAKFMFQEYGVSMRMTPKPGARRHQ